MVTSARLKHLSKKMGRRRLIFASLSFVYIFGSLSLNQFSTSIEHVPLEESSSYGSPFARKLLSVNDTTNSTNSNSTTHKCTQPSIKEFPKDVFTQQQRRYGAVLLHVFLAMYMFVALAFVCDDYFISALDKICERLDLSEDVAGATFMAAGSSAPELFTSIIGVFITKGDVGVGTIVGSAVFNILVIIALCALFAGQVVQLTWWPLFRDSICYIISIGALIWTLQDGLVTWYESLTMILLYIAYIIFMKFNPIFLGWINAQKAKREAAQRDRSGSTSPLVEDGVPAVKYTEDRKVSTHEQIELQENRRRPTWKELGLMIMLTNEFSPSTRFRAACLIVIMRDQENRPTAGEEKVVANEEKESNHIAHESTLNASGDGDEEIEGTPFLYPQGSILQVVFWIISLPLVIVLYFTIPDCRKPKWAAWYLLTFLASIFWIMIFSYLMVWMVCVIGYTLGIPDVIMGIIFLAAGTSIPDAISSLLVAREGLGDMAVSNSIGSNIFDILIGLAVPWFIKTAMSGQKVVINSRGMIYSVMLLFASVLLTVLMIHCNKWRLDRKLGIIFTLLYLVFVTFSACIEFNLFGFVNWPTCKFTG